MGFLVDDEGTALMWRGLILAKALEQFLTDVRWGDLDYLLIDMPPGTGDIQMALSRLLPQAEMLVVTTPALAAQKVAVRVADMARRSYLKVLGVVENMSDVRLRPTASRSRAVRIGRRRRPGRGHRRAARRRRSRSSRRVSEGGDHGAPVVLEAPDSAAGQAFTELARRLAEELMPPLSMMGCTARIFAAVDANLAALDEAKAKAQSGGSA